MKGGGGETHKFNTLGLRLFAGTHFSDSSNRLFENVIFAGIIFSEKWANH